MVALSGWSQSEPDLADIHGATSWAGACPRSVRAKSARICTRRQVLRKALIAVVVASALFAVGAFAAVIGDVNSDNVASGEGEVGSCADEAEVAFTTDPAVTPTSGPTTDWNVTDVRVRFKSGGAIATDCQGALVDLALGTNSTGSGEPEAWVDATSCTAVNAGISDCEVPATAVRPIVEVAVLANGNLIPDLTGP